MTTFTARATTVTDHLTDLNLGAFVPTAYDDLAAADARVEDAVDRVRAGLSPSVDLDSLAADLVAGRIKPETAGKRLQAPAGARVSNLLDAVRAAAVAAEDRDEWTPTALRRSVAPEVTARLQRTAEDMLSSIEALPAPCRDHLAAVYEGDSVHYGPLTADQLDGLVDVIAPGRNMSTVSPTALAAVQRAQSAWNWHNEAADAFGPLYWLGTGVDASRNWSNEYTGAAGDAAATFAPALLLVGGDDVDLVAAGIPLTYLVAAGLVTEFAPIGDPFGDDSDEYTRRVERLTAFTEWRDAYRNLNMSEAGHLLGAPNSRDRARLRARLDKPAHVQVEAFRADYVGAAK
ncbi:hypothetical protein ACTXJ8_07075 [Corynebacterium variabile]|uniref:hypothetical protein n=1 Tax=Corynebacterium variabile TaxID=1727 RepID=UPI003FD56F37